jgi:protocatechuate 3,4-dioxygenase beta subunit
MQPDGYFPGCRDCRRLLAQNSLHYKSSPIRPLLQYSHQEQENYLRGVQASDASGRVSFDSIFPGCYSGRWPHVHFEVYPSLAQATDHTRKLATSQLAFPEPTCQQVYARAGYEQSVGNLQGLTLEGDGVFRDGFVAQLAQITGSVESGLTASLIIAI